MQLLLQQFRENHRVAAHYQTNITRVKKASLALPPHSVEAKLQTAHVQDSNNLYSFHMFLSHKKNDI